MQSDAASSTAIFRTALDALQAKYSAILTAGYPVQNTSAHDVNEVTDGTPPPTSPPQPSSSTEKLAAAPQYASLLRAMAEFFLGPAPKRQTPLVNAGYAVRVACVLQHVESFVTFHQHCSISRRSSNIDDSNGTIQIVVLGAGLDVTGLWSVLRVNDGCRNLTALRVRVVEVDFPSICRAKKRAIDELHLLRGEREVPLTNSTATEFVWRGTSEANPSVSYTLASSDLNDPSAVDEIFTNLLVAGVPTLVLSELVLAYLRPESRDNLLRKCSSLAQGSCAVLYEPLGHTLRSSTEGQASSSVLEAYKFSYFCQFQAKLRRGRAPDSPAGQDVDAHEKRDVEWFTPLAQSCVTAQKGLMGLGFQHVDAGTAGRVASCLGIDWKARELFDEHAALALHLNSYAVVRAFPPTCAVVSTVGKDSHVVDSTLFRRFMCGWAAPLPLDIGSRTFDRQNGDANCTWITSIEREDEGQVRKLFSQTYLDLYNQYPAIRRMVKTALRNDLCVGERNQNDDASAIGLRCRELGGDFLVVVQINPHVDDETALSNVGGAAGDRHRSTCRRVLGGIGIRQCTAEERVARKIDGACYEIHRLFVEKEFRGRGVGSALLKAAFDIISQQQSRRCGRNQSSSALFVVATTPAVLGQANTFYPAKGFSIDSEMQTGDLRILTYVKAISPTTAATM